MGVFLRFSVFFVVVSLDFCGVFVVFVVSLDFCGVFRRGFGVWEFLLPKIPPKRPAGLPMSIFPFLVS